MTKCHLSLFSQVRSACGHCGIGCLERPHSWGPHQYACKCSRCCMSDMLQVAAACWSVMTLHMYLLQIAPLVCTPGSAPAGHADEPRRDEHAGGELRGPQALRGGRLWRAVRARQPGPLAAARATMRFVGPDFGAASWARRSLALAFTLRGRKRPNPATGCACRPAAGSDFIGSWGHLRAVCAQGQSACNAGLPAVMCSER